MVNFDKFIFSLFEKYGYVPKGAIMEGMFLFCHRQYVDYWIVTHGLLDENEQYELFQNLTQNAENATKYPYARKNMSLLLLANMDELDDEAKKDENFIHLENDPLYFKKYVLPFTLSSFEELKELIRDKKEDGIEPLIMRDDTFEDLKSGRGYAHLLYSIVHKLPFIPIQVAGQKDFQQDLMYSSHAVLLLADKLESFSQDMTQKAQNDFINELIKSYEDEED